jgi:hypothetical protein
MRRILTAILVFLGLISTADALCAQIHYTKTTICRVLSRVGTNRALNVEIQADVEADHMHGALLIDKRCPGVGLWLDVLPKDADASVTGFDHVLWSDGPPGFGGRMLSGRFYGRLRIGGPLPMNPKRKKISIALVRVEDLSDTRSPTPSPTPEVSAPDAQLHGPGYVDPQKQQ